MLLFVQGFFGALWPTFGRISAGQYEISQINLQCHDHHEVTLVENKRCKNTVVLAKAEYHSLLYYNTSGQEDKEERRAMEKERVSTDQTLFGFVHHQQHHHHFLLKGCLLIAEILSILFWHSLFTLSLHSYF